MSAAAPAVVVIPARGGSVGVPLKNLQDVGGASLVARAVRAALATPSVRQVLVSTDHPEIAREARRHGATVVDRPADLAGGAASSESAVLHALSVLGAEDAADGLPSVTVLMQATSPFVDPADLDAAVRRVRSGQEDVVVAASASHDFQWRLDDGLASPVGHDTGHRPRRQDRAPHFRETGAFYVMRTEGFLEREVRFFGVVGIQAVDPRWAIEIDEPHDLRLARVLASMRDESVVSGALTDVDVLVTDFDGVHTDDHVIVTQDGQESVRVGRDDGMGVSLLRRAGTRVVILSTEVNPVVSARGRKLGVEVLQGIGDKEIALRDWLESEGVDPARVAYVGNDVNDLGAMSVVGLPVAVADARPEVLAAARLVLDRAGGHGAVREICDRILAGQHSPRAAGPETSEQVADQA
ncbi:acylneuraminate cytidylyltransferase [Isoptericola haloaureus]|uniref:N-acylneuraminate cytidylyltransferase n=1 Tax=Isoptericola haloaureus TaxID=1542902 RepID=A0ABU7Z545_9MICO